MQIPIAFTAPVTESYALILSVLGFAIVRWIGYRPAVRRLYPPETTASPEVAAPR